METVTTAFAEATTPQAPTGMMTYLISLLIATLGSSVIAGLLTTILGNARATASHRRDRYAQAVRALVAWGEYPYRIRRRTDDEPATLTALADRGHTLQEQLAEARGWIAGESRAVSEVFNTCIQELTTTAGPACQQAWNHPPVSTAAGMNLDDFGPRNISQLVATMERAIAYRFGIRRLMGPRWVLWRQRRVAPGPAP